MGVSKNRGGAKSWNFNRVFHYFHHPFWGTPIFGNTHMSHEKNPLTFHYTGWLIGILIMVWHRKHDVSSIPSNLRDERAGMEWHSVGVLGVPYCHHGSNRGTRSIRCAANVGSRSGGDIVYSPQEWMCFHERRRRTRHDQWGETCTEDCRRDWNRTPWRYCNVGGCSFAPALLLCVHLSINDFFPIGTSTSPRGAQLHHWSRCCRN